MKSKAISYSLWGDSAVYLIGIVRNAEYIAQNLPDWEMVVWYDSNILIKYEKTLARLRELGAQCYFRPERIMNSSITEYGTFWRFRTIDLKKYSHIIFRDADSRLSPREMAAVEEWIQSEKTLHVIRDHPYHSQPYPIKKPGILGGLWGLRPAGTKVNMGVMIANYYESRKFKPSGYGSDAELLVVFLDFFKDSLMIHDEVGGTGQPFPLPRDGFSFCGERIDEDERPSHNDRNALKNHLMGGAK